MKIRLTDIQYISILKQILEVVQTPNFKGTVYDSTTTGDKYTESNCGFCNEMFTTKDTALFPDEFPDRKSLKYREDHQRCPFDRRAMDNKDMNGCYYHCLLRKSDAGIDYKSLVEKRLEEICTKLDEDTVI